jgi:hypothetical protein
MSSAVFVRASQLGKAQPPYPLHSTHDVRWQPVNHEKRENAPISSPMPQAVSFRWRWSVSGAVPQRRRRALARAAAL